MLYALNRCMDRCIDGSIVTTQRWFSLYFSQKVIDSYLQAEENRQQEGQYFSITANCRIKHIIYTKSTTIQSGGGTMQALKLRDPKNVTPGNSHLYPFNSHLHYEFYCHLTSIHFICFIHVNILQEVILYSRI